MASDGVTVAHLLTADEWYDVARQFKPEMTREEFEQEWDKFQVAKAAEKVRRAVQ